MRFRAIHQVLPNLTAEDAIGEYALLLQRIWQGWGVESRLYVERTNIPSSGALPLGRLPSRMSSDEVLVYHHSIGSQAATRFAEIDGPVRVVAYHNITPPHLLSSAPYIAARASQGMAQLSALARVSHMGIADSAFNRRDLVQAGFRRTATVHLALAPERRQGLEAISRRPRPAAPDALPAFLHVGRLLPHKALEELLRVFAIYQSASGRGEATLHLVGDTSEAPDYVAFLRNLIETRRIPGVTLTGRIAVEQLFDEFARADLYLCTSRHEGFCVPLVECMFAGVPVVSVAAGAIRETAGGASIITETRDPWMLAELCHQVLTDDDLRIRIIETQRQRARAFTEQTLEDRLQEVFARLAAEVAS